MTFIDFQKSPTKIIEYIKDKKPKLSFDYDEIMYEAHHKAFTIAKITKLDLLKDIQDSLTNAMHKGVGFNEWKKNITPTLKQKGWLGNIEVTNPKTGEIKNIYVGSRRLKNIFDTNMRVAYNQERHKGQMNSLGEYFYYSAILDGATRPSHKKLHGTILPKNHPFWDTNYPPNDWGCRCKVRVYTKDELKAKGLTPSFFTPQDIASNDWTYNVGKSDNIQKIYQDKIDKLPISTFKTKAQDEFLNLDNLSSKAIAKKQLNSMIDEVIINKNQKYPINHIVVGVLLNPILKAIKNILNKDIKEATIIFHKNNLLHSRPQRKDKYGHSLKVEEMRQIVDILEDDNYAYIDTNKSNVVYIFPDKQDSTKINLIPIELNKKIKKFDKECYIITLDKQDKKDFEALLKGGFLKKVK